MRAALISLVSLVVIAVATSPEGARADGDLSERRRACQEEARRQVITLERSGTPALKRLQERRQAHVRSCMERESAPAPPADAEPPPAAAATPRLHERGDDDELPPRAPPAQPVMREAPPKPALHTRPRPAMTAPVARAAPRAVQPSKASAKPRIARSDAARPQVRRQAVAKSRARMVATKEIRQAPSRRAHPALQKPLPVTRNVARQPIPSKASVARSGAQAKPKALPVPLRAAAAPRAKTLSAKGPPSTKPDSKAKSAPKAVLRRKS